MAVTPQRAFGPERVFYISDAIESLRPGANYIVAGDSPFDPNNIRWFDTVQTRPSNEELLTEMARLTQDWPNQYYKLQRAREYPDFVEYLDGVVKGDQQQIQAYIDACNAIKAKYPKLQQGQ
jgi:hypothetical protein